MGKMHGLHRSRLHLALPLSRGYSLPSSSIISTQPLQDTVCSCSLLPSTKPCFVFWASPGRAEPWQPQQHRQLLAELTGSGEVRSACRQRERGPRLLQPMPSSIDGHFLKVSHSHPGILPRPKVDGLIASRTGRKTHPTQEEGKSHKAYVSPGCGNTSCSVYFSLRQLRNGVKKE